MTNHATRAVDVLTLEELSQLTAFKWRYSFEAMGFTAQQAYALAFATWRYRTGRNVG